MDQTRRCTTHSRFRCLFKSLPHTADSYLACSQPKPQGSSQMQCQQSGIAHLEFLHLSWPAKMQNSPVLQPHGIRLEEQWLLADSDVSSSYFTGSQGIVTFHLSPQPFPYHLFYHYVSFWRKSIMKMWWTWSFHFWPSKSYSYISYLEGPNVMDMMFYLQMFFCRHLAHLGSLI